MTTRALMYGLARSLTAVATADVAKDLASVLWRFPTEAPPVTDEDVQTIIKGATLLLQLGANERVAVRALIAAANVSAAALIPVREAIAQRASLALLEAICTELEDLAPLAPELVCVCGVVTFRVLGDFGEDHDDPRGRTMLAACRDTYVRILPQLFVKRPVEAVALAVEIIAQAVAAEVRNDPDALPKPQRFEFQGAVALVVPDDSSWWSQHTAEQARRAATALARAAISNDLVAAHCARELPALFWAELLACLTESPSDTVPRFGELLAASPLLQCADTNVAAFLFFEKARAFLDAGMLSRIAVSIGAIDDDDVAREFGLLIPEELRDERLQRLCAVSEDQRIPLRDRRPQVSVGIADDHAWLRRQGVDPTKDTNHQLLALTRPVEAFEQSFTNEVPPRAQVVEMLPQLYALHEAISRRDADADVERKATDVLAAAAAVILRTNDQPIAEAQELRPIVLQGARHQSPAAGERGHTAASWGRPSPRIAGAAAIMMFARRCGVDEELASLMDALSGDPIEAVRYQIFVHANCLFDVDRGRMWALLDRWVDNEQQALTYLVGPVRAIFRSEPDRTAELLARLWARADLAKGNEVRANLAPFVSYLADIARVPTAQGLLEAMFADATMHASELRRILADHRAAKLWFDDVQHRRMIALRFLRRVLAKAETLRTGEADAQDAAAGLAAEIAMQLAFSIEGPQGDQRASDEVVLRLFDEADDVLQGIAKFPMPDSRARMMCKLLVMWLRRKPENAIVATAAFVEQDNALHAWWNAGDLIEVLCAVDETSFRTPEARGALVKAAGRLTKFAGPMEPKLMDLMSRVSRVH